MDEWMNHSQTLKHLNILGTLNEVKELNGEIPLKYPNRLNIQTLKHTKTLKDSRDTQ